MYSTGRGFPISHKMAIEMYRRSAELNDANGQYGMGNAYYTGVGVSKDKKTAAQWFEKAAKQGHPIAQHAMGILLVRGDGVAKNEFAAFEWFLKSAKQDVAGAQLDLGQMYALGKGTKTDKKEAVRWLLKSVQQSYEPVYTRLTNNQTTWSKEFRLELQSELYKRGLFKGTINGKFGPDTYRALSALSRKKWMNYIVQNSNILGPSLLAPVRRSPSCCQRLRFVAEPAFTFDEIDLRAVIPW